MDCQCFLIRGIGMRKNHEKSVWENDMNHEITEFKNLILDELESLRIDIDAEAWFDPHGIRVAKCERANEMLDDCINIVKRAYMDENVKKS